MIYRLFTTFTTFTTKEESYWKTEAGPTPSLRAASPATRNFGGDKELMTQAEGWVLKSISIADLYKGNYLLACISYVLGKMEQSNKACLHAIEVGKRDNVDYKPASQLLDVIQKKLQ